MQHWDRGISGRLQRVSTPVEQGCEVSVHSDQMDPLPEQQQSQPCTPVNPTAYRSMRDHIHPPRVSAPSCIIPPAEEVAVRPYLVPLLPTFHGTENENPYSHIQCHTPTPYYRQVCRPLHRTPQPLPLTTRKSCEAKPYCLLQSRIKKFLF